MTQIPEGENRELENIASIENVKRIYDRIMSLPEAQRDQVIKIILQFLHFLENRYNDFRSYKIYHAAKGSTPDEAITPRKEDFPEPFSLENFFKNLERDHLSN